MESDTSLSSSPLKDGQLHRNIASIIDFLNSPEERSDTVDSGTETSDCNERRLDILKDVVAYAEVKSNEDNRSRMIGRELERLGARVEKRFNKTVTHVIFYNGSEKTRQRAEKNGLHLVSVSWIQTCKVQGRRVPEADFPAAKISPKMIGAKRKKCRSMQPIPLEEELARSKERVKRKITKENRWKILLEGEAYADYSPSYLSKLKSNPHLVPETPADRTINSKLKLAGNMTTLDEEEECVSSVEESPISTAAIHKRLFDSDDSDNEGLPPLWERVKKFTPSRSHLQQTDDSDTSCEINLPRVGNSPDSSPTKSPGASPTKTGAPTTTGPVSDFTTDESMVPSKKGKRRSLGRRALMNSAKKAMQQRAGDEGNEGSKSPLVSSSTEDMFAVEVVTDTATVQTPPSGLFASSSSESVISSDEQKAKRGRRRSSLAPKLTSLVEDSSSGSDAPARRRQLLRPGDDNLLNPSPSVTPKNRRVSETPPSALTARDTLLKSSASENDVTKRKGRRKSVAVCSTSLEIDKPEVTLVEDPSSGSDVPARRRKLLVPEDDNILNPSSSVIPRALSASDILPKPSASENDVTKRKGRRKSVAVSSASLEKDKPKTRRRSAAPVSAPIVAETVKTKAKIPVPSPETEPMEVDDDVEVPDKKRKRPKFSSSDSDNNSKKPTTKKQKSKAQTTVAKDSEESPTSHGGLGTTSHLKPSKKLSVDNSNIDKNNSDSTSATGQNKSAAGQNKSSTGQNKSATGQNKSSTGQNKSATGQNKSSTGQNKSASGQNKSSTGQNKSASASTRDKTDVNESSRSKVRSKHNSTESAPSNGIRSTSRSSASEENNCLGRENPKLPGITLTSLHRDERSTVLSIIKKLGVYRITERVDESTTHVVCGETRRTLNVLHAITRDCWLLGTEWVFKSLENNKWLEEAAYSLDDDFPSCKTSRGEKLRRGVYQPDLFSHCGGILVHRATAPPAHELQTLVQLCQGEIVSSSRNAKVLVGKWRSGSLCVTEQWILDSVSSLKCQPFEHYLLRKEKS